MSFACGALPKPVFRLSPRLFTHAFVHAGGVQSGMVVTRSTISANPIYLTTPADKIISNPINAYKH